MAEGRAHAEGGIADMGDGCVTSGGWGRDWYVSVCECQLSFCKSGYGAGGGGESWLGGRVLFVIGVHIFTLDKI